MNACELSPGDRIVWMVAADQTAEVIETDYAGAFVVRYVDTIGKDRTYRWQGAPDRPMMMAVSACEHPANHRSGAGACDLCDATGLDPLIACETCGSAYLASDGCGNPMCVANPRLSDARRADIVARREQYRREQAARAERDRLYASSMRNAFGR